MQRIQCMRAVNQKNVDPVMKSYAAVHLYLQNPELWTFELKNAYHLLYHFKIIHTNFVRFFCARFFLFLSLEPLWNRESCSMVRRARCIPVLLAIRAAAEEQYLILYNRQQQYHSIVT